MIICCLARQDRHLKNDLPSNSVYVGIHRAWEFKIDDISHIVEINSS